MMHKSMFGVFLARFKVLECCQGVAARAMIWCFRWLDILYLRSLGRVGLHDLVNKANYVLFFFLFLIKIAIF